MEIVTDLDRFHAPDFSVVTIGTFDGVHLGHQAIIKRIVKEAKDNHGKSSLVTFWPHPRFVISSGKSDLKLLTTFEEKSDLIKGLGVDYIIKLSFTESFSRMSAEDFLSEILVKRLGVDRLFIGYDHHFGNNREGDLTFLKEREQVYNYQVNEISRQDIDDIGISSTKIRNALNQGDIYRANSLLGREYCLTGAVVEGDRLGRSLGFPTANIKVSEEVKLLPKDGVYAVVVEIGERRFKGMLNIGHKPTLNATIRSIEVNIFDFNEDIYSKIITVRFLWYIRNEMKFESLDHLKAQLHKDKNKILSYLS